jgi:septal ring factor EnvC (AmiA/AmiB activator)
LKIEISHDTLAKTVYDKASTEDRMRLMVGNLLKAKYQLFKEKHVFLTADELKSIAPFERHLDLNSDEKSFLTSSKIRAQSKFIAGGIIFVLTGAIIMGTLAWFVMYYRDNNIKMELVNNELTVSKDSLDNVNHSLGIKFEELRVKDSIHESLTERIGNDQEIIKMTNKELQNALNELNVLNRKLAESKKRVEQERDGLKTETKVLAERLRVQKDKQEAIIKEKLSAVEQSQKLSQRAHIILDRREEPTDAEYKEAFQLARYAWVMSKSNSQAMDVLNEINNRKIKSTSGSFLGKNRPKNTYTYRQIESIINKVDQKYNYGKLSSEQANRVIQSGS